MGSLKLSGWIGTFGPRDRSIFPEVSATLLVRVSGAGLAVVVQLILARTLGVSQFGAFYYVLNWIMVLTLVCNFGLHLPLIRFVTEYVGVSKVATLMGLVRRTHQVVFGLSCVLALSLATFFAFGPVVDGALRWTFVVGALLLPPLALIQLRKSFLFGLKKAAAGLFPEVVARPLILIGLVGAFILLGGGELSAPIAMALMVISGTAAVVLSGVALRRHLPVAGGSQPAYEVRIWLTTLIPFLMVAGSEVLISRSDVLILGLLRPEAEVGRYVAAGALAAALAMVPQSVEAVTLSHLAEFHAQGRRDDLQRLLTRTIWLSLGLVTPLALVVLSFGARLLGVNPKAS